MLEEFTTREARRQHLITEMEEAQQAEKLLSKKYKQNPNDEDLEKIISFKLKAREYAIEILMLPAETAEGKEVQANVHKSLIKAMRKDLEKKAQLKKLLKEHKEKEKEGN